MKSTTANSPPGQTAETIRRYVGALPAIQEGQLMDERTAQAVRSVLEQADPRWSVRLKAQIDAIVREVAAHLDIDTVSGRYAITDVELRGVVARAVSRTGGQVAVDIGQALEQTPVAVQFAAVSQSDDADGDSPSGIREQLKPQEEF